MSVNRSWQEDKNTKPKYLETAILKKKHLQIFEISPNVLNIPIYVYLILTIYFSFNQTLSSLAERIRHVLGDVVPLRNDRFIKYLLSVKYRIADNTTRTPDTPTIESARPGLGLQLVDESMQI